MTDAAPAITERCVFLCSCCGKEMSLDDRSDGAEMFRYLLRMCEEIRAQLQLGDDGLPTNFKVVKRSEAGGMTLERPAAVLVLTEGDLHFSGFDGTIEQRILGCLAGKLYPFVGSALLPSTTAHVVGLKL